MNAHGYALERALCAQHDLYRAQGIADIVQVPTPVTVLGRTTTDPRGRTCFRACMAARVGVDFVGWVRSPALIPVVMEAKAHAGLDSWSMDAVRETQAAQLDRGDKAGALAVVVLQAWGGAWVLPWAGLRRHAREMGRRTVRPGEVGEVGMLVAGYDWLLWWR